jgi:hypothetical protein
MSVSPYSINLPVSIEPVNGYIGGDRTQFDIAFSGKEIRANTTRLNGFLNIFRDLARTTPIDATDKLTLNPNAGISGFIRQLQVSFDGRVMQTINEYGRLVAIINQASKYYQEDLGVNTDAMLEIMTNPNHDLRDGTDFKNTICQGQKFPPPMASGVSGSSIPFSLDLYCLLNATNTPIPSSKTGVISISIIWQDSGKVGWKASGGISSYYNYSMTNLEVRYLSDVESYKGQCLFKIANNSHIPTIQNKVSALEFTPAMNTTAVVCSFLQEGHDNTPSNMAYDYLATETLQPMIDYLDIKVNGQSSDFINYALRYHTSEILYQALLAMEDSLDFAPKKHGLSYKKLTDNGTGFLLGARFASGVPANSSILFNVALKTVPSNKVRAFFYTFGFVQL